MKWTPGRQIGRREESQRELEWLYSCHTAPGKKKRMRPPRAERRRFMRCFEAHPGFLEGTATPSAVAPALSDAPYFFDDAEIAPQRLHIRDCTCRAVSCDLRDVSDDTSLRMHHARTANSSQLIMPAGCGRGIPSHRSSSSSSLCGACARCTGPPPSADCQTLLCFSRVWCACRACDAVSTATVIEPGSETPLYSSLVAPCAAAAEEAWQAER